MNKKGRAFAFSVILPFLLVFSPVFAATTDKSLDDFVLKIQKTVESRDVASYLDLFLPEFRDIERAYFEGHRNPLDADSVKMIKAGAALEDSFHARVFFQLIIENAEVARVEIWQLQLVSGTEGWRVGRKDVTENVDGLYKIRVPSGRAERVSEVVVTHADIRIVFKDAAVFYDNLPDLETCIIVVGRGDLHFSPSDPAEKHQLRMIYKKEFLDDDLRAVFIRCSDAFFKDNILITRKNGGRSASISEAEERKAASLFARAYPRSFTIRNSITDEILSFLPQSDEAVFDFEGRRLGEMTYIHTPFVDERISVIDRNKERILCLYAPVSGEPGGRRFSISYGEKFDVEHIAIDLDYNPSQSSLSAKAGVRIRSNAQSLGSVKFKFNPDLEILRIRDGKKRDVFYTIDKQRSVLYVYLFEPLGMEGKETFEIFYRGVLEPLAPTTDVSGQKNFSVSPSLVNPKTGTSLFTQSVIWYPGPVGEDYFTSRLKIILPPEFKCVAIGELVESGSIKDMDEVLEIEKMGNSYSIFESLIPVKYLAFLIGKLQKTGEGLEPFPLRIFRASDILMTKIDLYDESREILKAYSEWFGPFPFGNLNVIHRLWPTAGGHSPASFVVLNELPRLVDRTFQVPSEGPVTLSRYKEYFLAHEIAHQWWGQGVGWGSYRDQWISEGMAQFATALYLGRRYGPDAYASIIKKFSKWTVKKSDKGPLIMGSRLSYYDFQAFQAIVYDKAACVLNMLKDLLGDEKFFKGMRVFFQENVHTPVRTGQFRAAMEKASSLDLGAFFQGWFFSHELPEARVSWTPARIGEEDFLDVAVQQIRNTFVFPLWIEWMSGDRTYREKVIIDAARKDFRLKAFGKPSRVRINPDQAVPGRFVR